MWNLLVNIRVETLKLVANLDERSIDLVPEGFHNSIRWNIGHIVYDQDVWFHYLIEDESAIPKAYEKFFGFGTSPETWHEAPPSWEELLEHLRNQPERLQKQFAARLDEPLQKVTEAGMSTIGEIIPRTLYHEGLHQGTIIALRKSMAARGKSEGE